MTGEVAIITGAGSGIGLASALKLFGRGASILGVGRSPEKLTRLEAAIGDPSRVASLAIDVMQDDAPKRIVMHFVRGVSKNQIVDAFNESFDDNSPDATKTMKAEIDQFFGALDSVKDGDEISLTYVPGTGTTVAINGKEKLTIAAPNFSHVLFSVWLGTKPPSQDLKAGLLGR